ncbi:MAG: serine hydroxymethyltransferase [Patescibacteria group bacterium]|nr:serine hydroxymethyltransferase [Patescibacteria group bacterium]
MNFEYLKQTDKEIYDLILLELKRQKQSINLIPSENYTSKSVLEAISSILNDKYSEGYPYKRYYGGNLYVDELEVLCQKRALNIFNLNPDEYNVNVQPYSGTPANLAVYTGLLNIGDTILSLKLSHGGHLSHGDSVNLSGKLFNFIHYEVDQKTGLINYENIEELAKNYKPKLIISGFTAYPRIIDFKKISQIAKSVEAISMADISHIIGLIIGGVHPSPFPFCDIVTTTTHKTLRGPRGALIFYKKEFGEKINKAVFPGMQGGPHENIIAGIAVALKEAQSKDFKNYAKQIILNSKTLAKLLIDNDIKLVSGGTDNHLILLDLRKFGPGRGYFIEKALETADIIVNKNSVPGDTFPPYYPSGIRIGTPAITTRGMKEKEMIKISEWLTKIIKKFAINDMPDDKEKRQIIIKEFNEKIKEDEFLNKIRKEVNDFALQFPLPGLN